MNNTILIAQPPETPFKHEKGTKVRALSNLAPSITTIVDRLRVFTLDDTHRDVKEIHFYILEGYGQAWFNVNQIETL